MKIKGIVIGGKNLGEKLGFPTVNLEIGSGNFLEPGVYAGKVFIDGQIHKAGIFIGPEKKILEAHILDFEEDLRGKNIEVEVGNKLREVRKFNSDKELIEQIKEDISRIAQIETQIKTQKGTGVDFLYSDITYEIRGACFEVYKQFGGAFKEKIIENALLEEMKNRKLDVEKQKRIDIYFKDKKVGTYVPDMIVNKSILVELKAKPFITKEDERQFWLYLKGSEYKVGLLINFGSHKLEIRRRIYDKARNKHSH